MSKGLLVDTCAAVWILEDAPLSPAAITAMDEASDVGKPSSLSVVTAWELGMLCARRRLGLRMEPLSAYRRVIERAGLDELPMTADLVIASSYLPGDPPKDPFDRIVIASARAHCLTILTRDRLILAYAEAGHVSAIPC